MASERAEDRRDVQETGAEAAGGVAAVEFGAVFDALPVPFAVMGPGMVVLAANRSFLTLVGRRREQLLGRFVFGEFPPPEGDVGADGRPAIQAAMERVLATGTAVSMPIQRYPIPGPGGAVVDRSWLVVGTPLRDEHGTVTAVVQRVEDVTDLVAGRGADAEPGDDDDEAGPGRIEQMRTELLLHARELAAALAAKDTAAQRAAGLAEVALALTSAATVEDVESVVIGRGATVLGVDGGAVVSRAADGDWRITVNAALGPEIRARYDRARYDSPLPACWTARTGRRLVFPDRRSGLAFDPVMADVHAATGRDAWAFLPLVVEGERLGCLAVSWIEEHSLSTAELDVLDAFAAQCAVALRRIQTAEAQRASARQMEDLAGALQQALLTPPPEPDHLHLVVRYQPANDVAQVGGDWYDAFMQPDGATMLAVGDVVGHDSAAAAKMGQLRGLLRALAYAAEAGQVADAPAAILTRFEHAAVGLSVDTLATAVLARIERVPNHPVVGARTLRWSNAGHPPPVLLLADGTVTVLERAPDLMLGVDPDAPRHDHTLDLPDRSTLLLFTDGLVERRGASFDDGMQALSEALAGLADVPLEQLADTVLQRLEPHTGDDDIALIAVRAYPDSEPRPADAGPNLTPADQPDR